MSLSSTFNDVDLSAEDVYQSADELPTRIDASFSSKPVRWLGHSPPEVPTTDYRDIESYLMDKNTYPMEFPSDANPTASYSTRFNSISGTVVWPVVGCVFIMLSIKMIYYFMQLKRQETRRRENEEYARRCAEAGPSRATDSASSVNSQPFVDDYGPASPGGGAPSSGFNGTRLVTASHRLAQNMRRLYGMAFKWVTNADAELVVAGVSSIAETHSSQRYERFEDEFDLPPSYETVVNEGQLLPELSSTATDPAPHDLNADASSAQPAPSCPAAEKGRASYVV